MNPIPDFSNVRLNFKQLFWAVEGREKGIFAAFPGFLNARRP
jgi:hypothetical protein